MNAGDNETLILYSQTTGTGAEEKTTYEVRSASGVIRRILENELDSFPVIEEALSMQKDTGRFHVDLTFLGIKAQPFMLLLDCLDPVVYMDESAGIHGGANASGGFCPTPSQLAIALQVGASKRSACI